MLQFHCDPACDQKPDGLFAQTITLTVDKTTIARARWQSSEDPADGVVQILDFQVSPDHRRRGIGQRLMDELIQQAGRQIKTQGGQIRRIWVAIEQKRQVIARSFLMRYTFHHVGTVKELLRDQDVLIYARSFN